MPCDDLHTGAGGGGTGWTRAGSSGHHHARLLLVALLDCRPSIRASAGLIRLLIHKLSSIQTHAAHTAHSRILIHLTVAVWSQCCYFWLWNSELDLSVESCFDFLIEWYWTVWLGRFDLAGLVLLVSLRCGSINQDPELRELTRRGTAEALADAHAKVSPSPPPGPLPLLPQENKSLCYHPQRVSCSIGYCFGVITCYATYLKQLLIN